MSTALEQPWTEERFLTWVGHQDRRYEFDGSRPVAMTGGSNRQATLTRNLMYCLMSRLQGRPCQPLGPDAGVAIPNGAIRYPDALITGSKYRGEDTTVPGVVSVFEVISPGSARTDRIDKVREYAMVDSIRRYFLIEPASQVILVLHREHGARDWVAEALGGEDILRVPEAGVEFPVAEIYQGVDLSDTVDG